MFRLWGKTFSDNHIIADYVSEIDNDDTRTHKIFKALDEICVKLNLETPTWLDKNINEFKRHNKTRFNRDSYAFDIDYEYFEIEIIEE